MMLIFKTCPMFRYSRASGRILVGRRYYASGNNKWQFSTENEQVEGNRDKTYDALNSSNIDTMQRILGILDAETEQKTPSGRFGRGMRHLARNGAAGRTQLKPSPMVSPISGASSTLTVGEHENYNNAFSTEFGKNIFKYELFNFLNRNNTLAVNKEYEQNYPHSYDSLYALFSKSFGSYLRTPFHGLAKKLAFENAYQTLAHSFVTENREKYNIMVERSLQMMSNLHGLRTMSPSEKDKFEYNLPMLYIPPAHMRGGGEFDILTLNDSFLMQDDELNLLPFILDNEYPGKTIERWQAANQKKSHGARIFKKLSDSLNVEGELAFSCLVKKVFYKLEPDETNMLIMNEIQNLDRGNKPNDRLKAIIAYKSRILRRAMRVRMLSYRLLEMNVELMPDRTIEQYLVRSFNRYFAVFFRTNPTGAERWLTDLILNYNYQHLTTQSLYNSAIQDFRDMEFDAINAISLDTWREDGKAFIY